MLGPASSGPNQKSTCDAFTLMIGLAYEKREREREKGTKRRFLPRR